MNPQAGWQMTEHSQADALAAAQHGGNGWSKSEKSSNKANRFSNPSYCNMAY
jgi:hypothetical protein